jgi:hypothetical protein
MPDIKGHSISISNLSLSSTQVNFFFSSHSRFELGVRRAIIIFWHNLQKFNDSIHDSDQIKFYLVVITTEASFNPSAVALTLIIPAVVSGRIIARHIP